MMFPNIEPHCSIQSLVLEDANELLEGGLMTVGVSPGHDFNLQALPIFFRPPSENFSIREMVTLLTVWQVFSPVSS